MRIENNVNRERLMPSPKTIRLLMFFWVNCEIAEYLGAFTSKHKHYD
jgi:hypothetical protein